MSETLIGSVVHGNLKNKTTSNFVYLIQALKFRHEKDNLDILHDFRKEQWKLEKTENSHKKYYLQKTEELKKFENFGNHNIVLLDSKTNALRNKSFAEMYSNKLKEMMNPTTLPKRPGIYHVSE